MNDSDLLIHWYRNTYRDLPWRKRSDPYAIYLSEIILQQTQVKQGLPYYEKFIEAYPTVHKLAKASEDEVLKMWQGLGYYSRARNLHGTAQYISRELQGIFPSTAKELIKLKGVGEYTAAAIASFAFNEAVMVIDGNVERLISRLFNIQKNVKSADGRSDLTHALSSIFSKERPAEFNQAIMELGSQICKPRSPLCGECPFSHKCIANQLQVQESLPNKGVKTKIKSIEFHYLVVLQNDSTFITQRTKGLWKNLYEFPLIEGKITSNSILDHFNKQFKTEGQISCEESYSTVHLLSHRRITAHFYTITSTAPIKSAKSSIFEIGLLQLDSKYPIATLIDKFLQEKLTDGKQGDFGRTLR